MTQRWSAFGPAIGGIDALRNPTPTLLPPPPPAQLDLRRAAPLNVESQAQSPARWTPRAEESEELRAVEHGWKWRQALRVFSVRFRCSMSDNGIVDSRSLAFDLPQ